MATSCAQCLSSSCRRFWSQRASTAWNLTSRCLHASCFKSHRFVGFLPSEHIYSHVVNAHNVLSCRAACNDHGQLFHNMLAIVSLSETESKRGGRSELSGGWGWGARCGVISRFGVSWGGALGSGGNGNKMYFLKQWQMEVSKV